MSRPTRSLISRSGNRPLVAPPRYDDNFHSIRAWAAHASSVHTSPESALSSHSRTPSSVLSIYTTTTTSATTTSPASKRYRRHSRSSSTERLWKDQPISRGRVLSFIWGVGVVAVLLWWGCRCQTPPEIRQERIAKLSSAHAPFALDVVKRLLKVKGALPLVSFDTQSSVVPC